MFNIYYVLLIKNILVAGLPKPLLLILPFQTRRGLNSNSCTQDNIFLLYLYMNLRSYHFKLGVVTHPVSLVEGTLLE